MATRGWRPADVTRVSHRSNEVHRYAGSLGSAGSNPAGLVAGATALQSKRTYATWAPAAATRDGEGSSSTSQTAVSSGRAAVMVVVGRIASDAAAGVMLRPPGLAGSPASISMATRNAVVATALIRATLSARLVSWGANHWRCAGACKRRGAVALVHLLTVSIAQTAVVRSMRPLAFGAASRRRELP
jgi:hypothetical protein